MKAKKEALVLVSGYKKLDDIYFEPAIDMLTTPDTEVYKVEILNPYIVEIFEPDLIIAQAKKLMNNIKNAGHERVRIMGIEFGAGIAAYIANNFDSSVDVKTILFTPMLVWNKNALKLIKKNKVPVGYEGPMPSAEAFKNVKLGNKVRKYFLKEILKVNKDNTVIYLNNDYKSEREATANILDKAGITNKFADYEANQLCTTFKKTFLEIVNKEWDENFK